MWATLKPWLPLGIGAVLVALLVGVGIGRLTGPLPTYPPPGESPATTTPEVSADGHIHGATGADGSPSAAMDVGGLSLSASGYTLVPADGEYPVDGDPAPFEFTIIDSAGFPVTEFTVVHDKPMHLFVVRRDLSGFQHLHPEMDASGVWRVEATFDSAGPWRVITDFTVEDSAGQTAVTLGTDVSVPGDFASDPLPKPALTAAADGFDVEMEFEAQIGVSSPLLMRVADDGGPAELEPYLGAFGHLVVLRQGDLGFLHVHPDAELVDGALRFWATVPSTGTYRMYLDFQVDGEVHTAEFTLTVE